MNCRRWKGSGRRPTPTLRPTCGSEVPRAGAEAAEEPLAGLGDLRLVPLASATWAGAWLGTAGNATAVTGGVCAVGALGVLAAIRRSGWLLATTLVLGMGIFGGAMFAHRLSAGPVGELVASKGIVIGDVVTTSDPICMP